LGDETGVVKGFFYQNESLKEGNTIVIFRAEATVVKEHIEVQLMERGRVDVARRDIKDVNKSYDVSAKEWIEQS
jgi:ssDNA-binding replication factor A large subunit